jgi:outer membrane protein assembly factor BamB
MPRFRHPWLVVAWVACPAVLALPAPATAQPPPPPREVQADENTPVIQLPTDGRLKRKLDAAHDYLAEQAWGEAARLLQSLLDAERDSFVAGKDPNGKPSVTTVSVRAEAGRLLATMPPKGREQYEQLYGKAAAALVKEAQDKKDPALLAQTVRRFLYTRAGALALRLLASHHLAAGNLALAANSFAVLLERQEPKEWTAETLYEATLAFRRAGDRAHAAVTWKQLQGKAEGGKLRIGDRTQTLAEWEADLDGSPPPAAGNDKDWPVYRGGPGRSNEGSGDKPFMVKDWAYPTIKEEDTRHLVDSAVKMAEGRGLPVLPAFSPVAADGKVIYRDYWGLHLRDLHTGKIIWESDSRYSIDRLLSEDGGSKQQYVTTWAQMYLQMARPGVLFENSVVGTLSTDASRVYAVEDLYLPPPNLGMPWNGPVVMPNQFQHTYGVLRDAVFANTLNAYSLHTGKLVWEDAAATAAGERGQPDKEKAQPDNPSPGLRPFIPDVKPPKKEKENRDERIPEEGYFLGPPLPLDGKLYVLKQLNQELRLVCLEPKRGELQWTQPLATLQTKLSQDVNRRTWAAHLAYGEGILVCPTNAGMLLGVDLLSHSVAWAHPYRENGQAPVPNPVHPMIRRGMMMPVGNNLPEWKVTAPVVQDGRVVFTAPDGSSVRCLNLRDGSLVWKANRTDDDLYLGGVARGKVLIVGKRECRALTIADGSKAWQTTTGLPSGQGVFGGSFYYLPLKEGRNREPEVCALDIDTGRDVAHARSRQKELPGNLVLCDGKVISQTVDEVAAFPQLRVKIGQMNARIARNPQDPVGLAERAELRLDNGDLAGAITDLRAALKNDPPPQTRAKARAQLYDTLTEFLRDHFDAAEPYLKDYEELCKVEVAPDASPEERQQAAEEQQRRRGNYLGLVARGREAQGQLTEALQGYLDFAEQGSKKELVSILDEKAVRAPADVWAHGRISAMLARANPEQQRALTEEIARKWQAVREDKDIARLRTFVRLFGSAGATGRGARLLLAERLGKDRYLPEAERELLILRRQSDDPVMAARATETLARLMARHGLMPDAAHYYRVLGREFPRVVVRDGKTGADLLNDLATDKRFLPYVQEPDPASGRVRKVHLQTENGMFQPGQVLFGFEAEGNVLPFFRRYRVGLDPNLHNFRLVDRETNEVAWQAPLTRTQFFNFAGQQGQQPGGQAPRYTFETVGHVIVLPVGHMVCGIDPVGRQVLWEQSLLGRPGTTPGGNISTHQDPKDGSVQILFQDGFIMRLGQCGPAAPSYVCLQTRDGLLALDPLTGQTLWTRNDVRARAHLFGDDQYVYLVEMSAEGNPVGTRAFRASDGVTARDVPEFTAAYQNRQRLDGRRVLASETQEQKLLVRLYDIPTGKDVWKKECPAGTLVVHCEEPHLGALLEPDGTLTALDLRTAREVLKAHVAPKDFAQALGVSLVRDETQYYLLINGPRDSNVNPWGPISNFQPGTGYRCLPVNGKVYAFDAGTGKVSWSTLELPQQMLVLEQFRELPVLLFTTRINRMANGRFGGMAVNGAALTVLNKRTGKYLADEQNLNAQQFHTFHADLSAGKIELVGYNLKVTLTLEPAKAPGR